MSATFKWTTIVWLGVLAAGLTGWGMVIHDVLEPVGWIVLRALFPIVLPPLFVVFAVTPWTASIWQVVTVAAIAVYVWLFGLILLGFVFKALNQQRVRPVASL